MMKFVPKANTDDWNGECQHCDWFSSADEGMPCRICEGTANSGTREESERECYFNATLVTDGDCDDCPMKDVGYDCRGDQCEQMQKWIAAIRKQIPHKVHGNLRWCECGGYIPSKRYGYVYCPSCGQKIDWSDIDEM